MIDVITPLREGRRQSGTMRTARPSYFNSRPCERGDKCLSGHGSQFAHFNSRPCERGDVGTVAAVDPLEIFQFTPLREGRLCLSPGGGQSVIISIHAPARGATRAYHHM